MNRTQSPDDQQQQQQQQQQLVTQQQQQQNMETPSNSGGQSNSNGSGYQQKLSQQNMMMRGPQGQPMDDPNMLRQQQQAQQQYFMQQQMRGGPPLPGGPQGQFGNVPPRGGMMPPNMYPPPTGGQGGFPPNMGRIPPGYPGGGDPHNPSNFMPPPPHFMTGGGMGPQNMGSSMGGQGTQIPPMHSQQQQQLQGNQSVNQLVGPLDLRGITQRISAKEVLDAQVEKTLAFLAEDFVKTVAEFSCKLAKHRGSDTLEKEDIKFAIEKLYNIPTPIKSNPDKPANLVLTQQQNAGNIPSTNQYKQNMILVKKANETSSQALMK